MLRVYTWKGLNVAGPLSLSLSLSLPLMSEVMPSLLTKTLSSSSLPVNSSATTYRSGLSARACSSINYTQPKSTPGPVQTATRNKGESHRPTPCRQVVDVTGVRGYKFNEVGESWREGDREERESSGEGEEREKRKQEEEWREEGWETDIQRGEKDTDKLSETEVSRQDRGRERQGRRRARCWYPCVKQVGEREKKKVKDKRVIKGYKRIRELWIKWVVCHKKNIGRVWVSLIGQIQGERNLSKSELEGKRKKEKDKRTKI